METHLVSFGNYLFGTYGVKVHSTDGKNTPLYQRQVSDADLANWKHENPDLGLPMKSLTFVPPELERLYVIEGIFHAQAATRNVLPNLTMCNEGPQIYFTYSEDPENSIKGVHAHGRKLSRKMLEDLSILEVTRLIVDEIDSIIPKTGGGIPYKKHTDYPSRYKIGEKVKLFIMPEGVDTFSGFPATITAVHFTESKVKYDLEIEFYGDYTTRVYNIDSILVKDLDWEGEKL